MAVEKMTLFVNDVNGVGNSSKLGAETPTSDMPEKPFEGPRLDRGLMVESPAGASEVDNDGALANEADGNISAGAKGDGVGDGDGGRPKGEGGGERERSRGEGGNSSSVKGPTTNVGHGGGAFGKIIQELDVLDYYRTGPEGEHRRGAAGCRDGFGGEYGLDHGPEIRVDASPWRPMFRDLGQLPPNANFYDLNRVDERNRARAASLKRYPSGGLGASLKALINF